VIGSSLRLFVFVVACEASAVLSWVSNPSRLCPAVVISSAVISSLYILAIGITYLPIFL